PFDWYWNAVSPALGAGAGRFQTALATLSAGPDGAAVPSPRLAELQAIAAAHGPAILAATVGRQVSPALVVAVIGIESGGRPAAVSPKGATGLMQLIPATAERFGVTDSTDPAENIKGGVAYLDWLMGQFGRDPLMVLAAYNAGEGAVRSHGGVPPFAETRAYVPKVLAAWSLARGLCLTPPELVSDGCVFRVAATD
ncbi:MAG: lytic transglycosylase domain-containing protein, partial [Rhodobacteraceae bacterium]|nr:lytic transglycosylase domain-containing protein [Paracoccaceae bacterium]